MNIRQIGVVHNDVAAEKDGDWGSVVSEIRLDSYFAPGLAGLTDFSHAVIVFLMHNAHFDPDTHLARRPRDRDDMPMLGVFAQRAKHRPNPIGITTVAIERLELADGASGSLFVRGLDAINGTPVLDIKPHFPAFDAPKDPKVPEWVDRLMQGYF
jgi:tRNA-Thr(GGU) m(6)t(6)A37 methyltransferase TsaA